MLTKKHRQNQSELTLANLACHNESTAARDKALGDPKMEQIHKEEDQYRRFLVTGDSPHQRKERERQMKRPSANAKTLRTKLLS